MLGFEVKNSLVDDPQIEQRSQYIATTSSLLERNVVVAEVNVYQLVFDINRILVATGEGSTRSRPMVLRPMLKELFCTCVKKFNIYIWFSTMKIEELC